MRFRYVRLQPVGEGREQGRRLPDSADDGPVGGLVKHPAPNLEPGDVPVLEDGRDALVTARLEAARERPLTALLEVLIAPPLPSA